MRILLVCAFGMSTSIIASKIKAALSPDEQDWVVDAKEVTDFKETVKNYDIILLGPQIGFRKEEFIKIAEPLGTKVMVINSMDYGLCKGDSILNSVKNAMKTK